MTRVVTLGDNFKYLLHPHDFKKTGTLHWIYILYFLRMILYPYWLFSFLSNICYLGVQDIYQIGPSGVRALPLAAGINVGGHYCQPQANAKAKAMLGGFIFTLTNKL